MNIKKKRILFLGISVLLASPIYAQSRLSVGDTMPDVEIPLLLNYRSPGARISDFKGKLLILDFWGTWCSPCVANLPKTDSLQQKFAGKVQFLPVTDESIEKVRSFAENYLREKRIDLMTVYDDRALRKLFNFNSVPYYVWIDQQGVIIAKTSDKEITAENIQKVISNKILAIKNREDIKMLDIDQSKPIFNIQINQKNLSTDHLQPNLNMDSVFGHSVATGYITGLPYSTSKNDSLHYFSTNVSVSNLYSHLFLFLYYGKMTMGIAADSRIVYEIKSPEKLAKIKSDTWGQEYEDFLVKNGRCYEMIWPKTLKNSDVQTKFNWVKDDLDRYFGRALGINVFVKKRMVQKCMVLEKIGSTNLLKTTNGKSEEAFSMYNYKMVNTDFDHFFNRLSGYFFQQSEIPVVDHTGIKGRVNLDINCNMRNIKEVNDELYRYGLKINIKPALADVLVFKDLM